MTVRVETFVSRADPELGAQRLEITPRFEGTLQVKFRLREWDAPHRYPLEKIGKLEGEAARN